MSPGHGAVASHHVAGQGEPPVLLLHGIGGGAAVWTDTIEHLAPDHRTAAWTMPGYADSPPLPEMTWPALADAAVAPLDHLGMRSAVVVGHSFGGMVAQEMALCHADRVAGLVLVGTVAAFGGGSPEFVERYLADRLAPLDAGRSPADFAGTTIASLVAAPLTAADHHRAVSAMSAISPDAYRAALTCLTTWDRRDRLAEIGAPTLVVAGEVDPIAPPRAAARLAQGIPGARSVVLPATGHLVNLEAPAAFHDALDGWLADLAVRAPTARADELVATAARLGAERFAPRAAAYDVDARFPVENYDDLREAGFLGLCIPERYGGLGADFETYCLVAAELGRHCGATALTFNMHSVSCLWSAEVVDDLDLDDADRRGHEERRAALYADILRDGVVLAQPFSEPEGDAGSGKGLFTTTARPVDGGWLVSGRKHFASLSGHADRYSVVCTEDAGSDRPATLFLVVDADADGVAITGTWDPLGMRGTVSRTLELTDVFVPAERQLMPRDAYRQAARRWPYMFFTLTPTYVGIARAAYDFAVAYLRGEVEGGPAEPRRSSATKQLAVAEIRLRLDQAESLWRRVIAEAGVDPDRERRLRLFSAQWTVMEHANEVCRRAIAVCGGRSIMRSLPLERLYRDSRCGSLMLPYTAEVALERLGHESLYQPGERD